MNLTFFERYVLIAVEDIDVQGALHSIIAELDPKLQVLAFYDYANILDYLDRLPRDKHLPLLILIGLSTDMQKRMDVISHFKTNQTYDPLDVVFISSHFGHYEKDQHDHFRVGPDYQQLKKEKDFIAFISTLESYLAATPRTKSSNETLVFRNHR